MRCALNYVPGTIGHRELYTRDYNTKLLLFTRVYDRSLTTRMHACMHARTHARTHTHTHTHTHMPASQKHLHFRPPTLRAKENSLAMSAAFESARERAPRNNTHSLKQHTLSLSVRAHIACAHARRACVHQLHLEKDVSFVENERILRILSRRNIL